MPLDGVASFARERGLVLIEDCAQAFVGWEYRGHPGSDVTLFSFGPIKTRTALGGALMTVRRRPELLDEMRRTHDGWPIRSRGWFLARTLKYAAISLVASRVGLSFLRAGARLSGTNHDELLSRAVRGFHGPAFFESIRQRPPFPLLALLHRRLRTMGPSVVAARGALGERAARLMPWLERPGADAAEHTHWVFPICPTDPERLMLRLWAAGFDATRGASSLMAVPAPTERLDTDPMEARRAMDRLLYLPVHRDLSERALQRLAREVAAHEGVEASRV
jgi:dTDP-4-amino-4,6-dideoxygalactose transaminase